MSKSGTRIPLEGRLWLGVMLVFFGIGLVKSLNLILLLSYLMLMVWGLNYVLAGQGLRQVSATRRIQFPIFAASHFNVEIELRHCGKRAIWGIHVEDKGPDHRIQGFLVSLSAGQTHCLRSEIALPRRCYYYWKQVTIRNGFPFGLVQRWLQLGDVEYVPVFPPIGRIHRNRLRHQLRMAAVTAEQVGAHQRPQPLVPTEIHGMRQYRSGDSPRWIHWRTSARRGEWMIREFEEGLTENLMVILEPWLPPETTEPTEPAMKQQALEDLEEAIELTAALAWEWCRQPGDRFTLAVAGFGPVVVDGATGQELAWKVLDCLAVQGGSPITGEVQLMEKLAEMPRPGGPVLVVTTRPTRELADALAERLHRPVSCLHVSAEARFEFYERPEPHAA